MRTVLQSRSSATHDGHAPRGRHRYVQDGEVPVVVINPRQRRPENREGAAELERALGAEREARRMAEKALQQAEETIRHLQTRLAHAEIAQQEATVRPAAVEVVAEEATPSRKRRVKPAHPLAEDEAVEWWTPGWRERLRNAS